MINMIELITKVEVRRDRQRMKNTSAVSHMMRCRLVDDRSSDENVRSQEVIEVICNGY